MRLPVVTGVIDRRILVNYRVDADVLASHLPAPFRPKRVGGAGLAGICLIRLRELRPCFLPRIIGVSSENAAHRIAVEWTEDGRTREGVYVRRRDTNSRFNTIAGGRLFPGVHHHARFVMHESKENVSIAVRSDDGIVDIAVRGHRANILPNSSVFDSLEAASTFFQRGALGFSKGNDASRFEALELECSNWCVEPLAIDEVNSSYFDDKTLFPKGSIDFDCALLMRNIVHQWHTRPALETVVQNPSR